MIPMFWLNGLIHPEKKRKGAEQRKAIHAGPWFRISLAAGCYCSLPNLYMSRGLIMSCQENWGHVGASNNVLLDDAVYEKAIKQFPQPSSHTSNTTQAIKIFLPLYSFVHQTKTKSLVFYKSHRCVGTCLQTEWALGADVWKPVLRQVPKHVWNL